jgi:putative flippase GtrA
MSTPKPNLQSRIKAAIPARELIRYLIVGGANTLIGTGTFVATLYLFNRFAPAHIHGIAVTQARLAIAANILTTPINITISYFNYKLFVFRTRGNYLREWLKAFGVYGVSTLIGLVALGALTHFVEVMLHGRAPFGKGSPGYIAGISMTAVTTIISYFGHKKVTFGGSPGHDEDIAADEAVEDN